MVDVSKKKIIKSKLAGDLHINQVSNEEKNPITCKSMQAIDASFRAGT